VHRARPADLRETAPPERPPGAAFRFDEHECHQPVGLEAVPGVRRHGDGRGGDPALLSRQRQVAGERDGDLDRVMAVELRVAEAAGRF